MTTQPAGEHHTGTLNLAGQGNPGSSPISDAAVEAAARRYYEILGWDWDDLSEAARDHEENLTVILGEFRAALEAAYPAIRQQVAEEIAVALEAEARSDYDAADDLRWAATKAREIGAP